MKRPLLLSFALFCAIAFFFLPASLFAQPLEQEAPEPKETYLCISLAQLIRAETFENQTPAPPGMDTLFGMSWLEGYIIDPEHQDIILFGKQDPSRRALSFFDVLINFQNIFGDAYQAPYCSLDPLPENMVRLKEVLNAKYDSYQEQYEAAYAAVGGQQVVVGGVPDYSRHAGIMIYADYDMKAVSQGHLKLPGVRSVLEIHKSMSGIESSLSSRYWFHIKPSEEDILYPNFSYNSGIVKINECPVVVLTEKQQMDEEGNLSDQETEEDPVAETFAREFSDQFSEAVLLNPNFCELENLFRLHALFLAMKSRGALVESGFDKNPYFQIQLVPTEGLPKELPGLVNAELTQDASSISFFIVAGGVSMEMDVEKAQLKNHPGLDQVREGIRVSQPASQPVFWYASF